MRVWVNGTFDVFHYGHLCLLEYASRIGELHVGIDSDERVQELKGPDRPIFSIEKRIRMLGALKCVHRVYVFNSDTELENIIKGVKPDVMVIGSDYKDKKIIGSEYIPTIKYYERIPDISTTKILNNENDKRNSLLG